MILGPIFYQQNTLKLAQSLIGTFISNNSSYGEAIGRIVETEAYLFENDPACHAHRGLTKRNAPMFGPAGYAYVYLIYGMYYCFNVVSGPKGKGEAVLIRAIEPVKGIELMHRRRLAKDNINLGNGPGKLVLALGIEKNQNGESLLSGKLTIHSKDSFPDLYPQKRLQIVKTTRIGISKGTELPYRFYLKNNQYVSRY